MVREKNCFNYHNSKKCNFTRRHEELHKQAFHEFSVRRTIFRYDWAKDSVKSQIHSYLEDFGWKIFRSRYPQIFSCRAESQSKIQGRSWWHLKVFMASKCSFFFFILSLRSRWHKCDSFDGPGLWLSLVFPIYLRHFVGVSN